MRLRNLIRPLMIAMPLRCGARSSRNRRWVPVWTMALCFALGCGKAIGATASDQLSAKVFDPKTGMTATVIATLNPKEGLTEGQKVEAANFTIPKQIITFTDPVTGKPALASDTIAIESITGTITSGAGGEPSSDPVENETLFSLKLNSNEVDTLTATGRVNLETTAGKPGFVNGKPKTLEFTETSEGPIGTMALKKKQTLTVGPEKDDEVTLNPFSISFASLPGADPSPDDAENKDPIFSLEFSSGPPVVSEPGTLVLLGAVLLGVALRSAQWKFSRAKRPASL